LVLIVLGESIYLEWLRPQRVNFPFGLFNDMVVAGKMRLFGEEIHLLPLA